MSTDSALLRMEEIERQIALLHYEPCQCESYLELKIRAFGGSEHYVRQCNNCGHQKGGALKATDALAELNGQSPRIFDPEISDKYYGESSARNQKYSSLITEKHLLQAELNGLPEPAHIDQQNKYSESYEQLSEQVDAFVQNLDVEYALQALHQQERRLKKIQKDEASQRLSQFSTESELKSWMVNFLQNDFHIYHEVSGIHIAEKLKVRIDYVLYPKKHLVDQGFERAPFGIEVKYLNQEENFAHKASRAVWQAISYNDCEFSINDKKFNLKFCLLFSNLSFTDERRILDLYSDHKDGKDMKWTGMLNVANHAKVGVLKVIGKKDRAKGWSMSFAGGNYFNCHLNKDGNTYKLSNPNTINKVRVGNF